MKSNVKRTLGLLTALVLIMAALPVGALAHWDEDYYYPPYYNSPWGGYMSTWPYYYQTEQHTRRNKPSRTVADTVDGMAAARFKGDGAYVYDNAAEDMPLAWVSSSQTIYLDEANQYNGWIMVYYKNGNARGWAKQSQINR